MKILLLFIFLFIRFSILAEVQASSFADSTHTDTYKTVLIINSYHPETEWSQDIVSGLDSSLKQAYPGIHVHSGNLNIEEAQTSNTSMLSMRAIIWQMAEQEGDSINPQSLQKNTVYRECKIPDVIVFVGEEALFQHLYLHLFQGSWSKIPIVCCAMNDSISNNLWMPRDNIDMSDLRPMNLQQVMIFTNVEPKELLYTTQYITTPPVFIKCLNPDTYLMPNGDIAYLTKFNTTGVISSPPIQKNLELLKQMMPEVAEVVWVDNHYYKNAYTLYRLRQELPKILPHAKLSVIYHNRINTDSIYDVMLQPVKNRAFITYAWNINGLYSRRPERQIDSLFSQKLTSPILTLTGRNTNKNYWLGGVHTSNKVVCEATFKQITQLLDGKPIDSIPYVNITETETRLNMAALKHFGLEKRGRNVKDATFQNIPLSFYEQHEKVILASILILVILISVLILVVKRIRYTKKIQTEYINYEKLYKRLQAIYQNSAINFALYDECGMLISRIIEGQESNVADEAGILPDHLFNSPSWLNKKNIQMLRDKQTINEEIKLEVRNETYAHGKEEKIWNLIIKPLPITAEYKISYIATAMDLTPLMQERKAKERSESIFQFVSETAGIGVASYNLLTKKGYASKTWHQNLNENVRENTLPTYENVLENDRQQIFDYLERTRKEQVTEPFIQIIQVKDPQGNIHYIQEYIFVKQFNPAQNIISVVELNINYDEPQQRENSLKQAKEQAEASNRETEEFLANISHEIRTPLNAIVGFSNVIANTTDAEEISILSPIIEQNNKLLLALIDNILYLSKLDSNTLIFHYTPENIGLIFDGIMNYANELAREKSLTIIPEISNASEYINVAFTQLNLVLHNLISNAIKFTAQGTITIGFEKREKEYYFFVKDTGCGIPLSEQENIFKQFYKLDVFTQGTGLGLSLCRSIITYQGGKIGIISTPGQGSTFWFTLPIVEVEPD